MNGDCLLKICDFGLARGATQVEEEEGLSEYVATRWYRAPEVILSWNYYTKAIDMWSVGCIFAELIGRKPLFRGTDYIQQINCILDIIGTPSEEEIANTIQNEKARKYVRSLGYHAKVSFAKLYPQASLEALDLLEGLLTFDPMKRITVEQALEHPYFVGLHDPNDEPSCPSAFNFDFEKDALSKEQYRGMHNVFLLISLVFRIHLS